jgi:hypothetical protein
VFDPCWLDQTPRWSCDDVARRPRTPPVAPHALGTPCGSRRARQVGPRVRIHLPPARSQQRTLWLPGGVARGWDPEFESALLQRGVRNEPSRLRGPPVGETDVGTRSGRSRIRTPDARACWRHRGWRICTCAGLCCGGRSSALSKASGTLLEERQARESKRILARMGDRFTPPLPAMRSFYLRV